MIKKTNKWDNPGGFFFHSATDFPEETRVERREDFIIANIMGWMDLGFCMDHMIDDKKRAKSGVVGGDCTAGDGVVGTKRPRE